MKDRVCDHIIRCKKLTGKWEMYVKTTKIPQILKPLLFLLIMKQVNKPNPTTTTTTDGL